MFTITNKSEINIPVHKPMAILIIHLELFVKIELHNFRAVHKFLKVPEG